MLGFRLPAGCGVRVTREAARWITELADFRGEGASKGDLWYQQCARTTGFKGTGNAGTWNQVSNVRMTYVVRCLAGGT